MIHRTKSGLVVIAAEKQRTCARCHEEKETRPAGPNGERLCFASVMVTTRTAFGRTPHVPRASCNLFVLEVFSCSGGMAEGLRRAGLPVTMAVDKGSRRRKSLGHAPVLIDARDLVRLLEAGVRFDRPIDLFVADPPCTPWSRAGKRHGQADERDMLAVTVQLVRLLRPRVFLIANVPGLDDGPNWPTVQKTIGSLSQSEGGAPGYCIDFVRLDAANYGVPQHRMRPFWYGHPRQTPHIDWPMPPTHCDPRQHDNHHLPGTALIPWMTCRRTGFRTR